MKHIYYLLHYSHIPMQLCSYSQLILGLKSKLRIWQNETSFWHKFEICIPCVGNKYYIIVAFLIYRPIHIYLYISYVYWILDYKNKAIERGGVTKQNAILILKSQLYLTEHNAHYKSSCPLLFPDPLPNIW